MFSSLLITVFIALAFLTAHPAGEGLLYLSDSVAVAAIVMGIAAWREKVYGLVIGIHISLLLMARQQSTQRCCQSDLAKKYKIRQ
jgi:hypothetical protein